MHGCFSLLILYLFIGGASGQPQNAALNVQHVLPDHSAPEDGSLEAAKRELIPNIRTRALALKSQGVSAEGAGKQIGADLKTKHPDWPNTNAAGFV